MSIEPDVGGDLTHVDGLETVTLRQAGESAVATLSGALRRRLRYAEAEASGGRYQRGDVVWHVSTEQQASMPRLGSILTDAEGVHWTVLGVERETLALRWRIVARSLIIAKGLDELITIQRARWTAGRGGDAQPAWHDWRCGLPARIQPQQAEIEVNEHRRQTRVTHKVFLAENIPLDENHRFKAADGSTYTIRRVERAARIDELTVVHVCRSSSGSTLT